MFSYKNIGSVYKIAQLLAMESTFHENFNDWELDNLIELMGRLKGYNMNPQAMNIMCWDPQVKEYTVKKGYKKLHAQNDNTDFWP